MSSASKSTKSVTRAKLRVFFDADVLIAGAASKTYSSASYILLQLAELTLIDGVIGPYVREEAERNLRAKLPQALPVFLALLRAAVREVPDAPQGKLKSLKGHAHPKDVPVMATALASGCQYLVTFNLKHYPKPPAKLRVVEPGELVLHIRQQLAKQT